MQDPRVDFLSHGQTASADAACAMHAARIPDPSAAALPPILLDDVQGARVYGVSLRKFLELQHEPWFPAPRMLGKRAKRHVYSELLAAAANMPRQELRSEPAQLRRARIERAKRDGVLA